MTEKKKIHPMIPVYVDEKLKEMGYKPSEALVLFYNERCIEDPEKDKELLLRKKKLERGLKILTEELEDVNKQLELRNKKFKQYNVKDSDNYGLALDEVFDEIKKAKNMVEVHNKYGYKLKKDKIKEICMKHDINPKIIISELKKEHSGIIGKYVENI